MKKETLGTSHFELFCYVVRSLFIFFEAISDIDQCLQPRVWAAFDKIAFNAVAPVWHRT